MFPTTDLDQPVPIKREDLALFDDVDTVFGNALLIGDPQGIFDFGTSLIRSGYVRAHALAKLLHKTQAAWEMFGLDVGFEDEVYTRIGIAPATTKKYVRMWDGIFNNPNIDEHTKRLLLGRPIRDLLLLTAAAREGSLDNDDLKEIATLPDQLAIRDYVRNARGEQTSSSSALRLSIVTRDDHNQYPVGTLLAFKDGERFAFGVLDLNSDSEVVKQAATRIINAAGIQEI